MLTKMVDREPIAADENELTGLADLERLIRDEDMGELRLVGRMGEAVTLTESAVRVLRRAIGALAEGRVVDVRQMPRNLTTTLAAELLGTTHAYCWNSSIRGRSRQGPSTGCRVFVLRI